MFWPGGSFFVWVGGMNGGRDERTDCQRDGCMVVPGAVVSPGHTRRLRRLSCRAPHNSPCTLMRTWLRQMGLTLRLVAAEYLPARAPGAKYDQRLTRRTGSLTMQPSRWQSVRSGFWWVVVCRRWWVSALRWIAGAEFPLWCAGGVGYQRCVGWLQG